MEPRSQARRLRSPDAAGVSSPPFSPPPVKGVTAVNEQVVGARTSNRPASSTGPTAEELAELRLDLEEQRAFRVQQLAQLEQTAPALVGSDGERAAPSQLEVHVKLCASARMVLTDVEAALQRMDEGTYAVCGRCRGPVALTRLRVIPQARYCENCHRVRESTP